ncbi:MAG: hemerythrin family protein [Treponema sp.]|jgi:hemerythrin|nr:hemerythrin family protein [Treponema sp.]
MEYLWDASLETGNATIDEQHKQLFKAVNELIKTCDQGKGTEELKKSLDFLTNYTIQHFFDEEKIQQKYKYPDYENHRQLHEKFKKDVRDLSVKMIMKGASPELLGEVQSKIGDWLLTHIRVQDLKLAAHLKAHPQA